MIERREGKRWLKRLEIEKVEEICRSRKREMEERQTAVEVEPE